MAARVQTCKATSYCQTVWTAYSHRVIRLSPMYSKPVSTISSTTPTSSDPVIIVGGGILGLTTASALQDRYPRRPLVVVAKELPDNAELSADYASAWAGAHYRPIPASSPQLKEEAEIGYDTVRVMKRIAMENPESGVQMMPGCEYFEDPPEANLILKTGDKYAGEDDDFRVLEQHELPSGVKWGCVYQAYCVNVPMYCSWLLSRVKAKGGKVVKQTLNSAHDAFEVSESFRIGNVSTVINCSGRNFDLDPRVKIIRGQTVLVSNPYYRTVTRQNEDGSWAFLIPRPNDGGTIVGGSKEVGDVETRARPETRQKLLEQAVQAFPDFVSSSDKFDVVRDNVGRRPWREGGVRMDIEEVDHGRIIHCYGAGGRGYELSWGIADRVLGLLDGKQSSPGSRL